MARRASKSPSRNSADSRTQRLTRAAGACRGPGSSATAEKGLALSDADRALFRAAIGAEEPDWKTPDDDAATGPGVNPDPPPPIALQRRLDEQRLLSEFRRDPLTLDGKPLDLQPGDTLRHRRDGVSERQLRRLARGDFRVDDEIDLHGLDRHGARDALRQFLARADETGRTCLRIIHGKGLRSSAEGPVLKKIVDHELRQRDRVLAFVSAPPNAGGTGAVLVLLRRQRPRILGIVDDDQNDFETS